MFVSRSRAFKLPGNRVEGRVCDIYATQPEQSHVRSIIGIYYWLGNLPRQEGLECRNKQAALYFVATDVQALFNRNLCFDKTFNRIFPSNPRHSPSAFSWREKKTILHSLTANLDLSDSFGLENFSWILVKHAEQLRLKIVSPRRVIKKGWFTRFRERLGVHGNASIRPAFVRVCVWVCVYVYVCAIKFIRFN